MAEEELTFDIKAGESRQIELSFRAEPYFKARPHNLYTVQCGSLVFSAPVRYEKKMFEYETDGVARKFPYCDYELIPVTDWNYAYCGGSLEVKRNAVSQIPFAEAAPPVVIRAKVRKIDWGLEDGYETVCTKVPESRTPISEKQEIDLYPYGCAKLRMTEMPIVE